MLHILLVILKIIGIILGVILGILVLLTLIMLFVPVRYQLTGEGKGNLDSLNGKLKISWFLHLVSAYVIYHDQIFEWEVRIAWKKWNTASGEASSAEVEEVVEEQIKPAVEETVKDVVQGVEAPADKPVKEIAEEMKEETAGAGESSKETAKEVQEETQKPAGLFKKIKVIWNRIKDFFKNIKYTISKIYDKIKELIEKKDQIIEFLADEVHQAALRKIKSELIRLLKSLRPKRFEADILAGFEDPYNTGRLLAGYSMIYPFIGGHAHLTPDFEKRILEGRLLVKGRIKAVYFIILSWNLFWTKAVRKTYRDIRGFKL